MNSSFHNQSWVGKFQRAFRGIAVGIRGGRTNSFQIHMPVAIVVVVAGLLMRLPRNEFVVLVICIGLVLTAELFNSCLEKLSRAITQDSNENIRDALDIASGAVLVVSLMAALVGAILFIGRMLS